MARLPFRFITERRRTIGWSVALAFAATGLIAVAPSAAFAESWCATPIAVHEWGVQRFDASGTLASRAELVPSFAITAGPTNATTSGVWQGPADMGERSLPVVQIYTSETNSSFAIDVAVGFSQGEATVWYPQVSVHRDAATANDSASQLVAQSLETLWAQPGPYYGDLRVDLVPDPRMQLVWNDLQVGPSAPPSLPADANAWVDELRANEAASWLSTPTGTERFLYYEATTTESPAIRIERADTWSQTRDHYQFVNDSSFSAYDVTVVRIEDGVRELYFAPVVGPGATVGFLLERAYVDDAEWEAQTMTTAMTRWVTEPVEPQGWAGECQIMVDPAVPFRTSTGYQLYDAEVQTLLNVWGADLFEAAGTRVIYREGTDALDALMPLQVHTDMEHYAEISRLSVVISELNGLP